MMRIAPTFRLALGDKMLKPYILLGPCFRILGKITIQETYTDLSNNSVTSSEWKYSNGFSMGITTAAGVICQISPKFSAFGELSMVNQSWGPKKGKLTKYSIDGVDMLPNMNPYQKEIDFLDDYTATNYNPSAAWSHRQQLKQYYPFSSIGINIGIHYSFGKK